ncbi:hypothetical protein NN561_000546 [Cricetulus griseus]
MGGGDCGNVPERLGVPRAHHLSSPALGVAFVREIRDGRENRSPHSLNGAEANAVDPWPRLPNPRVEAVPQEGSQEMIWDLTLGPGTGGRLPGRVGVCGPSGTWLPPGHVPGHQSSEAARETEARVFACSDGPMLPGGLMSVPPC